MASELLQTLLGLAWAAGVAIVVVLVLGGAIHRLFGAQAAYLAWLTVPAMLLAAALPGVGTESLALLNVASSLPHAPHAAPALRAAGPVWSTLLVMAWAAGGSVFFIRCCRDHARFMRGLGPLLERGGLLHGASVTVGPAVVGLWRPRIIVPADFSTRYTAQERHLILAHEKVHALRRDPVLNAVCALIQCVFWFNPLVHLGAHRFRLDQELACDAAVMLRYPGTRRSYAEAMLKTQLSGHATLLSCHWQARHPLKERIMCLKKIQPNTTRRLAGRLVVAALICSGAYGALAANAAADGAKPVGAELYQVDLQLTAGGAATSPRVRVHADEPFAIVNETGGIAWRAEFMLHKAGDQSVKLESQLKRDDRLVGRPALLLALGEPAGVKVGGDQAGDAVDLRVTVSVAPPAAPE